MKKVFLALILSSCSPVPQAKNDLPHYSDMGAAADAGRAAAPPVPEGM